MNANGTIEEKAAVAIETVVHAYLAADLVRTDAPRRSRCRSTARRTSRPPRPSKVKVRVRPKGKGSLDRGRDRFLQP